MTSRAVAERLDAIGELFELRRVEPGECAEWAVDTWAAIVRPPNAISTTPFRMPTAEPPSAKPEVCVPHPLPTLQ
jgi:hypothetical protein